MLFAVLSSEWVLYNDKLCLYLALEDKFFIMIIIMPCTYCSEVAQGTD